MFLCRRLLFQANIAKSVPRLSVARRNISNATRTAIQPKVLSPEDTRPGQRTAASTPPIPHSRSSQPYEIQTGPIQNKNHETRAEYFELDAYEKLRTQGRTLVADLSAATYLQVLEQAIQSRSHGLVNQIAADVLEVYRGDESERVSILQRILLTADFFTMPHDMVLSMLHHVERTSHSLEFLSTRAVERLARAIAYAQSPSPADTQLLDLIRPILIVHLQRYRVPSGAYSLSYTPPGIVHASIGFLQRLLSESRDQHALDVFRVLVDCGQMPPEAIQSADSSSKDFKTILCSALIRASLHWNWRGLAARLLTDLLDPKHSPNESVIGLTIDVAYTLLDAPTPAELRSCGVLIRTIHRLSPVPSGLVRQFYHSAALLNVGDEAERLYAFTRMPTVIEEHQYPPPQGVALAWLMQHLAFTSKQTHLSRKLGSEVAKGNLPIPLHSRSRFISITAAHGYGSLARTLWERYSVGKDKGLIVGNSALMIRMTSLFSHLIRRTDGILGRRKRESPKVKYPDEEILRQRSDDMSTFRDRILSEYKTYHEPLADANHQVLTSLARACFIVGKFAEGFDAFKILLDRKEVPDLYDVNVALTAMAEQQPRSAARMIERMIEKGLQPDAVTFGTVMHHALLQKDMTLVRDMVSRARGLKDIRLSLKSVAALVRASVAPDDAEFRTAQRSKLEGALDIIKSLTESNFISSPQTGKYLVFASLRADEPVMAYRFWKLLLRDSTEWDDREQIFQRRLIAQMIERHHKRRWLDKDRTAAMLSQLRQRSQLG